MSKRLQQAAHVTGRDREVCTCLQTQLEVEAETARVAAVPAEGLVVRLNSLARLLDALAAQEAKIQEWWQDVRSSFSPL